MSTTRTQAQRRAATRAELLAAAERVIAEHGYDAGSLAAIAEAAGVSKGALYHHFQSKDELLLALLDDRFAYRIQVNADVRDHPEGDVPARLVEQIPFDRNWNLLFLEFVLRSARDPAFRREFRKRLDSLREVGAESLERFWEARGIESDVTPADVTVIIAALTNGLAIEAVSDPRLPSTDPLLVEGLQIMLEGSMARSERLARSRGKKGRSG